MRPPRRDRQKRIFLRADKTVPYGELMRVMNLLRAAGYLKVALVGLEGTGGEGQPHGLDRAGARAGAAGCREPGAAPMTLATDLFEPRRTRLLRWTGAAVLRGRGARRLHGAGADALAGGRLPRTPPPAPWSSRWWRLPVATPSDMPDVAHGPLMEEAQAHAAGGQGDQGGGREGDCRRSSPRRHRSRRSSCPCRSRSIEKKPEEESSRKRRCRSSRARRRLAGRAR